MNQSFSRIEVGCLKYYLLTKLVDGGKEGFDLTICDGAQVWHQQVEASKVLSLAKSVDTDVSDFACQTARALTCQTKSQDNFVYQAKPQGSNLQFAWKKHVGDGIKFQLGCLTLPKVVNAAPVIKEIFDLAVEQTMQLKVEISSLKSDNARLSSERRDALKLLDKCVSAKEEIETDLFQKFAAVLNDKKSKIRKLKSQVQEAALTATTAVKDHRSTESSIGSKENSKMKDSRRNESSEDDTDAGESSNESFKSPSYSTTPTTEKSTEHQKPGSTVTQLSSSLLLEDGSEEFQPAAKRRRRRDIKSKESPAAKLVLPKVPSIKKTPSNSSGESSTSRPHLRHRASDKSLPDTDDLMVEMEM